MERETDLGSNSDPAPASQGAMRLCGWTAVLPLPSGELMVARGCCEGSLKPSIPEHLARHLAISHNCYYSYFTVCSIALPTDACKTACPALNGPRLLCFLSCWFCFVFFPLLSDYHYLQQFFPSCEPSGCKLLEAGRLWKVLEKMWLLVDG